MNASESLRTFIAIYRHGSVTEGAHARHITQPAASQQLSALERSTGTPLFRRTRFGVEPTPAGTALFTSVADSFDRIEGVLVNLETGTGAVPTRNLRIGASAEVFEGLLVPRLNGCVAAIEAVLGTDAVLLDQLSRAEVDLIITNASPPRRLANATLIGTKDFVLVAAPSRMPSKRFRSLDRLGDWLTDKPWVSYSSELPLTRRFWRTHLGRPFAGQLALVAGDLRIVAAAVVAGMGTSLLPRFSCQQALDAGQIAEVFTVNDLVNPEPWFACVHPSMPERPEVRAIVEALSNH